MPRKINLLGKRFYRLVVTGEAGRNKWGSALWACECDCGNVHVVPGGGLLSGATRSCGCLKKELATAWGAARMTTHGMAGTPEYLALGNAYQRCTNPKSRNYKNYGGRGIEFRFSSLGDAVIQVIAAIGSRPAGKTLDRVDNEGHYEAGNLRWATRSEQARNSRLRPNAAGRKGVTLDRRCRNKWIARIKLKGRQIHLGSFVDLDSAARAYDAAAVELHGEYACTNKMLGLLPDEPVRKQPQSVTLFAQEDTYNQLSN